MVIYIFIHIFVFLFAGPSVSRELCLHDELHITPYSDCQVVNHTHFSKFLHKMTQSIIRESGQKEPIQTNQTEILYLCMSFLNKSGNLRLEKELNISLKSTAIQIMNK